MSRRLRGGREDTRARVRVRGPGAGWRTVAAEWQGALFCVHHDLNAIKYYTVTHGLSGKAVFSGMSRDGAINIAKELDARAEVWRFQDWQPMPAGAREQFEELKTRVQHAKAGAPGEFR